MASLRQPDGLIERRARKKYRAGSGKHLRRRLMPLAYGLVMVVGLMSALSWLALKVEVTLAGFLNGESLWSKAQKQAVIDLSLYVGDGDPSKLTEFRKSYNVLYWDRWARDAIASGNYDKKEVETAFRKGGVMPSAIPGMIFMLDHFSQAPYMASALRAWRSVDDAIEKMDATAGLAQVALQGGSLSPANVARTQAEIDQINEFIQPRSNDFSINIAYGSAWLGHALYTAIFFFAMAALLLWFHMAKRILADIRGAEERYELLFDSAADAIVMVDEGCGCILDANRAAEAWSCCDPGGLVGVKFLDLFVKDSTRTAGSSMVGVLRARHGQERTVETHSSLTAWGDRPVRQAIMRDISDRIAMEQERRIAAEALASVVEGVIIADANRLVTMVNAAYVRITGHTLTFLKCRRFDEFRRTVDGLQLPASIWDMVHEGGNWVGEVRSQRSDGSTYPELLSISAIRNDEGRVQHYVAVVTDISRSNADRQRLEYMVAHDPLTGLANRSEFQNHCTRAIEAASNTNGSLGVLFVDLDAFKVVNDSYGHAIGDRLLVEIGRRICSELGERDMAGRIGGDEFTVLLDGLASHARCVAFAERLLFVLAEPVLIDDFEFVVSASIGIATYPLDGDDAVTLIANADTAMYAAKTQERNTYRFYTPIMHEDTRSRLRLGADLRQALVSNEFHMVYQPSVDMRTGRIVAVEALLRWRHPERGELLPDEFIPVAESLGLIRAVDTWALQAVCEQIRHWNMAGLPPVRVAINASASTFGHRDFIDSVRRVLHSCQIEPGRLLFEITESSILHIGDATEQTIHALHELGASIAIDDFGTGFSSLAYLKLSGVNYLKIDRSFVKDIPYCVNDVAIIRAMLAIAKSLGICTIAEGIETEEQHEFLLDVGCQEGQGYYYARGMAPSDVEHMLQKRVRFQAAKLRAISHKQG